MSTPKNPNDSSKHSAPLSLTHAGGIVTHESPHGLRYLVVRARRDPTQWVLPKGHIDPGETAEQAAVREVREEAGVEAEIVAYVGTSEYDFAGEHCRVGFYLMRCVREIPAEEEREVAWQTLESAISNLAFGDVRTLLMRAHAMHLL